jgi:superfamily II DNA or RNA helicase
MTETKIPSSSQPNRWGPGSLIHARGREWVVLTGSDESVLVVRPVAGSEEDRTCISLALEGDDVREAKVPPLDPSQRSSHDGALLLRDALVLSMRRGAGPFRSFGQIAIEPRAYQLVPLMMALKLDPVRLLIADDVGIGKTIEGALIARELLDRGDIARFTVLCPPHLVDQWVTELERGFHLRAAAVTASSARRLEQDFQGQSLFVTHPFTVVSLDYIKSERRRDEFLRACPELVLVDEAHACAAPGKGRHQRFELLRGLAENKARHMVFLTATPHSGDEEAFYRLLGLLDPRFADLRSMTGEVRDATRKRLAQHRRPDIDEWQEGTLFARRESRELTYQLTGAWEVLFSAVLDYCAAVVEAAAGDARRQRLSFWGTLALMRCVASSPEAAIQALRTRDDKDSAAAEAKDEQLDQERLRVFDGAPDSLPEDDLALPVPGDAETLAGLIEMAEKLSGKGGDPKLQLLTDHLEELLAEGFHPVVFCRYIATADYLGKHLADRLRKKFPGLDCAVVTSAFVPSERRSKVLELGKAERRLLIATDCLSEGINLQDSFTAVVHYDLSWNPTRHEQREGRVDRFGQKAKVVRTTLIYGANNPVDGAVLEVILRKAAKIREELGVPVPLPDDGHTLSQALLKAVMLRRDPPKQGKGRQRTFDFYELPEAKAIDSQWRDAVDGEKRSRTVFAQRRLKPEDVLPEWRKSLAALGGKDEVQRFTSRALARLGASLERLPQGYRAPLQAVPPDLYERMEAEGLSGPFRLDFEYPPAPGCEAVQRSHPLVALLAETMLEHSLASASSDQGATAATLGRVGCWIAEKITARTIVVLLRLRHQLTSSRGKQSMALVEEASALAFVGDAAPVSGQEALDLLVPPPLGDPPPHVRDRFVQQAMTLLANRTADLARHAEERAEALLADHRRVRQASEARGSYSVRAMQPVDVVAAFVLLPKVQ